VDEDLPWHSTISRTRHLYPAAVFERLFDHVFAQRVAAGLVAGDTQAVDSASVKASASLDSLCEKQPLKAVAPTLHVVGQPPALPAAEHYPQTAPAHQLRREAARQAKRRREAGNLGAQHAKAKLLSNKTPYSPTDPEARISVKPGKVRALNYLCSLAVDTAAGVISHIQADFADSCDSAHAGPQDTRQIQGQRLNATRAGSRHGLLHGLQLRVLGAPPRHALDPCFWSLQAGGGRLYLWPHPEYVRLPGG
jgi:hypothetical protein